MLDKLALLHKVVFKCNQTDALHRKTVMLIKLRNPNEHVLEYEILVWCYSKKCL